LPDIFPSDFGKRLERYLELELIENKIRYESEATMQKNYRLGKVVDYKVEDDILIECKAIELHPRSGVSRLPSILVNDLKSSIVKAYTQLLSTAIVIDRNIPWFGIIVTYKQTFIGFGRDAWDEFLREPVEKFAAENNISIAVFPPENLLFLTIEDWDCLMQLIKEKKQPLKISWSMQGISTVRLFPT
jgi:hypothetical protein